MFRIVFISALLALAAAQNNYNRDPKTAAILTEERYQQGDGKFGAAYTQEDGTDFKEETDADGTRRGSYSYIDPTGAKKTVSYTAGKHGFVASGDHLPVAPQAPAQPQQQYQPQYQGQPQYKAAPLNTNYDRGDEANFDDGSYDERYNNPSFSGNNAPNSYRAPAPQPQPQYQQPKQQQQYQQPQQQQYQPQPQQQQYQPQPQQNYQPQPQPQYNQYTTESPHRFQPPGKLSLNRTPDGYSYSFNKA